MFSGPQPSGPQVELKAFTVSDPVISQDSITVEEDAWRVEGGAENQTIHFFELPDPDVDQCMLTYRAQLKTEDVLGKVYLEMWCRLPGKGEFFSKGLHNVLEGTNDWESYEIPFYLKQGQKPDLLKLDLTIEGSGSAWVKDIQVLQTPLK